MAIQEYSAVIQTDAGTGPLTAVSDQRMLQELTAAALTTDALLKVELVRGGAAYPMFHRQVLPGGQSARLRLPPMRPEAGDVIQVSSDAPVAWKVGTAAVPAGIVTLLRLAQSGSGANTILHSVAGGQRWRVVGVVGCALSGGGASASLLRYTVAGNLYQDFVTPFLIDPFKSVRLTPVMTLEENQSLRARSDAAVQWFTYGVREQ